MNAMLRGAGCDYAALGNAIPIRYGPQAIADLAVHFGRPLICANYLDGNDMLVEGLVPFIIHDFGPFKLGIIGLTDPMKAYETIFRLRPQKPDEVLPELIRKARQAGAQTILLLSHLGLKQDQVLAENDAGLDVIIGGHSHDTLTSPLVENGTIIAQAGDFGRFLGRLDLEIDPVSGKVIDHKGTLVPINEDISPDPAATVVVENERKRVHAIMGRVIGSLNARVELADDRECTAGNLLADALLERMQGTVIALVLAGHWETGLEPGPLSQGQLFAANSFSSQPGKGHVVRRTDPSIPARRSHAWKRRENPPFPAREEDRLPSYCGYDSGRRSVKPGQDRSPHCRGIADGRKDLPCRHNRHGII